MIIGLTGSMGCGKGEIVKILQDNGFSYITLSIMVREEARRLNIPEERELLMEVGNKMRKEGGAGILAKKSLEKILDSECENWVIDGIRNPAEIIELRNTKDVYIVGVNANKELLVDRIISRGRESDSKERAEILRKLDRELGIGENDDGQQVGKCMKEVDFMIDNEGTLEELKNNFISYYNTIKND
jgi:dephospho-CoA kinase